MSSRISIAQFVKLLFEPRYVTLTTVTGLFVLSGFAAFIFSNYLSFVLPVVAVFGGLSVWGFRDLLQTRHSILRNYPLAAQLRFLFEEIRPEMRQYFFEDDKDGTPFSRDARSIVYQRSKNQLDSRPFGTQYDVYSSAYEWLHHSSLPTEVASEPFRITIGGPDCARPYSSSVFNISGMSFGALSPNALLALNKGARKGNFAHTTGEGGVSPYHREHGGDLVWQIGSGYFGCRDIHGNFCPETFANVASLDQIKMIEVKLSQGAKPGHGGVLPQAKITEEVARVRHIPRDRDCISPARHSAFSTPIEMMQFAQKVRELSGGKPVGFKLCIGHKWEFLALCKAMLETGITPDFFVIDGAEGGTGASPLEFTDHIGSPLREGLSFVHNALVGTGLRDRVKIGASGKVVTAFDMARVMALGADWCNSGRGFMFSLGCVQAQHCHTDKCPTGVATQDPTRQRALVVSHKFERVYNYHRATLESLAELVGAMGLSHPSELSPDQISRRVSAEKVCSLAELFPPLERNALLNGVDDPRFSREWAKAHPHSFEPSDLSVALEAMRAKA